MPGTDHAGWQAEINGLVDELLDPPLHAPLFPQFPPGPVRHQLIDGDDPAEPAPSRVQHIGGMTLTLPGGINLDDHMHTIGPGDIEPFAWAGDDYVSGVAIIDGVHYPLVNGVDFNGVDRSAHVVWEQRLITRDTPAQGKIRNITDS